MMQNRRLLQHLIYTLLDDVSLIRYASAWHLLIMLIMFVKVLNEVFGDAIRIESAVIDKQ